MNIKNEFIPYEEAIALKELGFDEPCGAIYRHGRIYYLLTFSVINSIKQSVIAAPLYQQAFRWLLLLVNKDKHFTNKWTISYNEDYYSLFLGGCNMEVFKAELDCIKYLIEIVKNKGGDK